MLLLCIIQSNVSEKDTLTSSLFSFQTGAFTNLLLGIFLFGVTKKFYKYKSKIIQNNLSSLFDNFNIMIHLISKLPTVALGEGFRNPFVEYYQYSSLILAYLTFYIFSLILILYEFYLISLRQAISFSIPMVILTSIGTIIGSNSVLPIILICIWDF